MELRNTFSPYFKKPIYVFILFILFFTLSCSNPASSDDPEDSLTITGIGWIIENIDPDFWSSTANATAYINFWIAFEETDLEAGDIESVVITAPTGRTWIDDTSEEIEENFDPEHNEYGGWDRLYSTYYTSNGSILPIGNYSFEVTLKSGTTAVYSKVIPSPSSTTAGAYSYLFTEDYTLAGSPPSGYTALPKRASINSSAPAIPSTISGGYA